VPSRNTFPNGIWRLQHTGKNLAGVVNATFISLGKLTMSPLLVNTSFISLVKLTQSSLLVNTSIKTIGNSCGLVYRISPQPSALGLASLSHSYSCKGPQFLCCPRYIYILNFLLANGLACVKAVDADLFVREKYYWLSVKFYLISSSE